MISLSQAIRAGARSSIEIGGDHAYFGDPVAATAERLNYPLKVSCLFSIATE